MFICSALGVCASAPTNTTDMLGMGTVRQATLMGSMFGSEPSVLATSTLGAECVDAQILVMDDDVDILGFRQHRHGRGAGMNAPLGFGSWHALHPVYAAFKLQLGIDPAAFHFQGRILEAAQIAFRQLQDLCFPALQAAIALVH